MAYRAKIKTIGDLKKFISERNIEGNYEVAFEKINFNKGKIKNIDLEIVIDASENDVTILFSKDSLYKTTQF